MQTDTGHEGLDREWGSGAGFLRRGAGGGCSGCGARHKCGRCDGGGGGCCGRGGCDLGGGVCKVGDESDVEKKARAKRYEGSLYLGFCRRCEKSGQIKFVIL